MNSTERSNLAQEFAHEFYPGLVTYIVAASETRSEEYLLPEPDPYMIAARSALDDLDKYGSDFKVDISDPDAIKIYSFTMPHLRKLCIEQGSDPALTNRSVPIWYEAIVAFVCNTQKHSIALLKLRQRKLISSCRVLGEMGVDGSGHSFAPYLYIDGIQQSGLAVL